MARAARVNLRRQLGNTLTGSLELRRTDGTASDGAEAVLSAMLQSPYFLYRPELGQTAAATSSTASETSPFKAASSPSFFLVL